MLQLTWAMVAIAAVASVIDAFLAGELSRALIADVVIGYACVGLGLSAIILIARLLRTR